MCEDCDHQPPRHKATSDLVDSRTQGGRAVIQIDGDTAHDVSDVVRAAVREELDEVLPHVVKALKVNDAARGLMERLRDAERRLSERESRPLVVGIRNVLRSARRLDYDVEVKDALVGELEQLLVAAGYNEFGEVGVTFVPGRHRALEGQPVTGVVVVSEIFEPGLEMLGEVVVPAQVRVASAPAVNETEGA
jgi:hypothetical protein